MYQRITPDNSDVDPHWIEDRLKPRGVHDAVQNRKQHGTRWQCSAKYQVVQSVA
jgi:hypothetical protein